MAREIRILRLGREEAARLERLCSSVDPDLDSDEVIFDRDVSFGEDRTACIQVISSNDPGKQPCWTQAVLFQHGVAGEYLELACTPPGDTVLGEYSVYLKDMEYTIDVVLDNNEEV